MHHDQENKAIEQSFRQLFARCDGVVGSEANYQAALAVELERHFPGRVRRERRLQATGRGGVDVVVIDQDGNPEFAFELKGGAYNSRNALQDVFSSTGNCSDMQRLAKIDLYPDKRWLVAVDAVELCRSLPYQQQLKAAEAAASAGVSFAYYGHRDESYLLARPGSKIRYLDVVSEMRPAGKPVNINRLLKPGLITEALGAVVDSVELEADLVSVIYSALSRDGYSPSQMALETYFGFAPGHMAQRPDLCLFEPEIEGHFNLYPRGNVALSNDSLKIQTLRLLVEVKGGISLLRTRDQTLSKVYLGDIEKLAMWRTLIDRATTDSHIRSPDRSFLFIGADMRRTPLSNEIIEMLSMVANRAGVHFMYIHMPLES
ncbi:hypothetical protein [Sedimenticola hydrogenitrophicus]|uniref:hypothetical protein n=1 Tax=Sedimenticola hydrogenitrophicus TaxID=2967975 RepID=UPI0023AE8AC1|nr:hypothetical protein [Sedimenticola hydrogenitrophicus]